MQVKKVLHDLKKIANTMRLMSMETDKEKMCQKLALLAQHLDKLHKDLDIKLNGGIV